MASVLLIFGFVLTSCLNNPFNEAILGEWEVLRWYEEYSNKTINQKMDFSFTSDKKYSVDYGSEKEKGKFWFVDDYLFTKEDGQREKSVKIVKLNKDTMVLRMNRGGNIESAIFLKK